MSFRDTPTALAVVTVRQHLTEVTQALKDGDYLGASLALTNIEKWVDAIATPEQAALNCDLTAHTLSLDTLLKKGVITPKQHAHGMWHEAQERKNTHD